MLYNLHLLRVIAALGVVYFHTTSDAGLQFEWDVGSRGVDVFFVISGFIIAYIGTSNPKQFFRRRLIRVVPFYWAATLVVFAAVAVAPELFRTATASVPHLLASLLFIPQLAPNGEMQPTLALGWSLNFEILFYVLFAIALQCSRHWSPVLCGGALIAYVGVVHAVGARGDIVEFYGRPIVLEFCYGIAAYYLFQWCSARRERLVGLTGLKWMLAVAFVCGLVTLCVFEHNYGDRVPRHLAAGIPSFVIVISALLLERIWGWFTDNRSIFLLGEASYIVYLVHPYIVFTVLRVIVKDSSELPWLVLALLVGGLLALTSIVSIAIHVWFEKPAMAYLRSRLT